VYTYNCKFCSFAALPGEEHAWQMTHEEVYEHAAMVAALVALPFVYEGELGVGYWVGVAGCLALLVYQHWVVRPNDLSRLGGAFFQANGALAVWLFVATAVDIVAL
jgi:4-hydroxybenzoate polyprenyltransferase